MSVMGVIHPPSIEELVKQIGSRLGQWTYLLVGVNAFLETGAFLGFIAPGETVVLFGGVLAGEGTIDLTTLIIVTWVSAMAGDLSAYVIGRRVGRDFLIRHGERVKVGEPQVQFVEGFFTRHGRATVLLGETRLHRHDVGQVAELQPEGTLLGDEGRGRPAERVDTGVRRALPRLDRHRARGQPALGQHPDQPDRGHHLSGGCAGAGPIGIHRPGRDHHARRHVRSGD